MISFNKPESKQLFVDKIIQSPSNILKVGNTQKNNPFNIVATVEEDDPGPQVSYSGDDDRSHFKNFNN